MRYLLFVYFISVGFFDNQAIAQVRIGQWKMHFSYYNAFDVVEAGSKIYCATRGGLFYYDRADNSAQPMTKIDGLSDVMVSAIAFDEQTNQVVVAYADCNIDVLSDKQIHNISDIKLKSITGNKKVNAIYIHEGLAYLSCGFAIIVVDLEKYQIQDTYYLGPNNSALEVFQLTFARGRFYALTVAGVYEADANDPFLSSSSQWKKHGSLQMLPAKLSRNIVTFNGLAHVTFGDSIYKYNGTAWLYTPYYTASCKALKAQHGKLVVVTPFSVISYAGEQVLDKIYNHYESSYALQSAIIDAQGVCWQADNQYGLIKVVETDKRILAPNGPAYPVNTRIKAEGAKVFAVSSSPISPNSSNLGMYIYSQGSWNSINKSLVAGIANVTDYIAVAYNPITNVLEVGTYRSGLVEFKDRTLVTIHDTLNSPIQPVPADRGSQRINDVAYDANQNLWVLNACTDKPVLRMTAKGKWSAYGFPSIFANSGDSRLMRMIVDSYGKKWITVAKDDLSGDGILVFDEREVVNGSPKAKKLTLNILAGTEFSNLANDLAEDRDGNIWVATGKGLYVYYNSSTILEEANPAPQQIKLVQDGVVQYLLESDYITSIEVDGANRKWIGTLNGVWLFSSDGTKALQYFNAENSPLPSNAIQDIAIDGVSGEVFFSTAKGIASYRSDATKGGEANEGVLVYPNPVRPGYTGLIGIKGLVADANVKITDITGTLVYQTVAKGGTATWDGKNFNGERAATGVYLVFITNSDGTETAVEKILFIN